MKPMWYFIVLHIFISRSYELPDEGKWDQTLTLDFNSMVLVKSLYKLSEIYIQLYCEAQEATYYTVNAVVIPSACWDYTQAVSYAKNLVQMNQRDVLKDTKTICTLNRAYKCNDHIFLSDNVEKSVSSSFSPTCIVSRDGVYVLVLKFSSNNSLTELNVHTEMKSYYGYLSASDWPLLPFYGIMCIYYVILGIIWLILSFMQWRDLLRVQFWIGAVILLGMLEKATFFAEYESINNSGVRVQGAMLFAEWVSCAKRTLARMLIIIVSLGFGIVKPRLGAALHRVVGVGVLYFMLAALESYLRIMRPKNYQNRDLLVASIPLAALDSVICWWIFSALMNTTRTLRLRRNEVKLTLYRHFTNTLIFSIIASVCFMLYSINTHRMVDCLVVWKDLWLEEAYWHILFSAILLVIMILWRPTNNNQRYAFVPLLDASDDERNNRVDFRDELECDGINDDDSDERILLNHTSEAFGITRKNRASQATNLPQHSVDPRNKASSRHVHDNQVQFLPSHHHDVEDNLQWLEEHVKGNDLPLSLLDSDENLVNTKFEVSKMQ